MSDRRPGEPQRLLVPCRRCGATVLRGIWRMAQGKKQPGRLMKCAIPLNPVCGDEHTCREPWITAHAPVYD